MNENSIPPLNLQEPLGPSLELDQTPPREVLKDSGTPFAVGVICTIALLAALVLVPLSRQAAEPDAPGPDVLSTLMESIQQFWPHDGEDVEPPDPPADVVALPTLPTTPDVAAPSTDPFEMPALVALKGQQCFNYMPGGDNPAARETFSELLWSKLEPDVRSLMEERLAVCSPFAAISNEVIKAGGCRKSECGSNDAHFYINTDGKVAIDYRVDGVCKQATEDGFSQTQLLCSQ